VSTPVWPGKRNSSCSRCSLLPGAPRRSAAGDPRETVLTSFAPATGPAQTVRGYARRVKFRHGKALYLIPRGARRAVPLAYST